MTKLLSEYNDEVFFYAMDDFCTTKYKPTNSYSLPYNVKISKCCLVVQLAYKTL